LTRILAINGSYREAGITDQSVNEAAAELHAAGAEVEVVNLRDYPIEFCTNCRQCALEPGEAPGHCVIDDGMHALIERIEAADGFIFASPTNLGSVTAQFKRFMERLLPYMWWSGDKPWPQRRKAGADPKPALLLTSSAAPGWLGRWMFSSLRQLQATAETVGAKPVGSVSTGQVGGSGAVLPDKSRRRLRHLARQLVRD
jgi:NAD(P)H-dependent FMN reductase